MVSKKHHYIPRFLLEGFTNVKNNLWTYNKETGAVFQSNPKDTACKNYYHAFENEKGERDTDSIEQALCEIENRASIILKNKIFQQKSLTEEEMGDFVVFISNLMVRVPNFRNNKEFFFEKTADATAKLIVSNKERFEAINNEYIKRTGNKSDISFEECKQFILKGNYKIEVDPVVSLRNLFDSTLHFAKIFFQMDWTFIKSNRDVKFLISDNPVSCNNSQLPVNSSRGVGLVEEHTYVTIPLSKDFAALATWKKQTPVKYVDAINATIKGINKSSIINAHIFFYASSNDSNLRDLGIKFKGSSPKIR